MTAWRGQGVCGVGEAGACACRFPSGGAPPQVAWRGASRRHAKRDRSARFSCAPGHAGGPQGWRCRVATQTSPEARLERRVAGRPRVVSALFRSRREGLVWGEGARRQNLRIKFGVGILGDADGSFQDGADAHCFKIGTFPAPPALQAHRVVARARPRHAGCANTGAPNALWVHTGRAG